MPPLSYLRMKMYSTAYRQSTHPIMKVKVQPSETMGETTAKEKPMRKVEQRTPTSNAYLILVGWYRKALSRRVRGALEQRSHRRKMKNRTAGCGINILIGMPTRARKQIRLMKKTEEEGLGVKKWCEWCKAVEGVEDVARCRPGGEHMVFPLLMSDICVDGSVGRATHTHK